MSFSFSTKKYSLFWYLYRTVWFLHFKVSNQTNNNSSQSFTIHLLRSYLQTSNMRLVSLSAHSEVNENKSRYNLNLWFISCDLVISFIEKQPSTISKVRTDFWHFSILGNIHQVAFEIGPYSKYLFWCATNHPYSWIIKQCPFLRHTLRIRHFLLCYNLKTITEMELWFSILTTFNILNFD